MKFDPALMARLQAATQLMMKDGPMAGTAAIQRALAGEDVAADDGTAGAPRPGPAMKDLNPPPRRPPEQPGQRTRRAAPNRGTDAQPAPGTHYTRQPHETPDPDGTSFATGSGNHAADFGAQASDTASHAGKAGMSGIAELLARAGIALPRAFKDGMPDGLAGFQQGLPGNLLDRLKSGLPDGLEGGLPDGLLDSLPEAVREQLRNANLPGARMRPPPPPLPDGARFDSASFTCHAGTRGYKLYVPSTYRDDKPVPLVVMLHGCTQDPDDFAAGTRMNEVAEETGCLVAYPCQSQHANSSKCWNWFSAADQQRERGEPAIIAGIARQVMADHAVDPARVGVAGLSAGGAMAVVVGALYPELFRAVGVHSGLPFGSATDLPSALQAMQQGAKGSGQAVASPPLIVFHGDKDHTVNPKNGRDVLQHGLAGHGAADVETETGKASGGRKYTRTIHRGKDGRVLAEHWNLHGGGHAWAGGSASGSYTDPTGPDASREMMRFFSDVQA